MKKNIFILFGILILFQVADIFFVEDLPLELEMIRGNKKFPTFTTNFLDGEIATEKIFEGKITALILWTTQAENTFELLQKIDSEIKNFPAKVQVIGLIGDKNFSDAEIIAKKYSPNLRHLKVNDDFYSVVSKIRIVPMIIFVDEKGYLIGQPVGNDFKMFLREMNFVLEKYSQRSKSLQKIQNIILNH